MQRGVRGVHAGERAGHVPGVHGPHDRRGHHRPVPLEQPPVRQQRPPVPFAEDPVAGVGAPGRRQDAGVLVVADLLGREAGEAGQVDGAQTAVVRHRVEGMARARDGSFPVGAPHGSEIRYVLGGVSGTSAHVPPGPPVRSVAPAEPVRLMTGSSTA